MIDFRKGRLAMDRELKPGDTIVFTGLLGLNMGPQEHRERFKSVAAECGLRVTTAVSGKTTFLVADDPETDSGKASKARDLGTPIVDYATYLRDWGIRLL